MSVLIFRDEKTVGVCAATMIAAEVLREPNCVIGVDYHETLLPVYDSLSAMTENGLLAWNDAKIYQLFEFLPDDSGEQRIANLLGKALFAKTDISEKQYVVPFSTDRIPEETARLFEESILNDGGLDVALVAVRHDGTLRPVRYCRKHRSNADAVRTQIMSAVRGLLFKALVGTAERRERSDRK